FAIAIGVLVLIEALPAHAQPATPTKTPAAKVESLSDSTDTGDEAEAKPIVELVLPLRLAPDITRPDKFIDDLKIQRELTRLGERLLDSEKFPNGEALDKQLEECKPFVAPEIATRLLAAANTQQERGFQTSYDSTVVIGYLYDCGKCKRKHTGAASGVLVSSDGLILTNHHVIEGGKKFVMFAMTADGRVMPVTQVVAADELNDIALIQIKGDGLPFSPIAKIQPAAFTDVFTVSHPYGNYFYSSTGKIARYQKRMVKGKPQRWMQLDGTFGEGSSGGPVFDLQGQIVGIISRQVPKLDSGKQFRMMFHHCVPTQSILDLCTTEPVEVTQTDSVVVESTSQSAGEN
ncbi:MAG: S1-C subfamily serine protease, partial [Mariniblastus sp.]